MRYVVAVPLQGAEPVMMEIEDGEGSGVFPAGRGSEVLASATRTFDDALERLQPMVRAITAKLQAAADSPNEIGVEFGIKMSMDAGLVVAHTAGEANFKVTLRWRRD